MKQWCTDLILRQNNKTEMVSDIKINRGIFQGDTLSGHWFVMSINPLSKLLNDSRYGYSIKSPNVQCRLTHLMYMDDLKLFASSQIQLKYMIEIVHQFSTDIKMEFGPSKCQNMHINRGKLTNPQDPEISPGITYIYI